MRGSREVGQGVRTPPPLKIARYRVPLSTTGPDPLENRKATKPAFNVGPLQMVIGSSLPSSTHQWRSRVGSVGLLETPSSTPVFKYPMKMK